MRTSDRETRGGHWKGFVALGQARSLGVGDRYGKALISSVHHHLLMNMSLPMRVSASLEPMSKR